jgi:hypothetical protein
LNRKAKTLYDFFLSNKIDWRFPNEYGLGEQNLDCRQLSVMEVLRWRGKTDLIPIFLNSFDCFHKGILLRRSEPTLQGGWNITKIEHSQNENIAENIRYIMDQEGYCLLYFNAFYMKLSNYYHLHDITHWSLVVGYNNEELYIADTSGVPSYFENSVGAVPWTKFVEAWNEQNDAGIAVINHSSEKDFNWECVFSDLVHQSVQSMKHEGGLEHIAGFISEIEQISLLEIVAELERIEFDIHYFRRLRDLWRVAIVNHAVPQQYVAPGLLEENINVNKYWSLVMGVLMKWKRQPDRDYREKLFGYLWEAYRAEDRYFNEMDLLQGGFD